MRIETKAVLGREGERILLGRDLNDGGLSRLGVHHEVGLYSLIVRLRGVSHVDFFTVVRLERLSGMTLGLSGVDTEEDGEANQTNDDGEEGDELENPVLTIRL